MNGDEAFDRFMGGINGLTSEIRAAREDLAVHRMEQIKLTAAVNRLNQQLDGTGALAAAASKILGGIGR